MTERRSRTRNRRFTTRRGNAATVWNERAVRTRVDGWSGCAEVVRTWVEVNGQEVEVAAGRSHQAEAAAHAAGH
jgi:hypothetical protein